MLMLPDFRVRQRDFLLEISRAITAQLDLSEVLKRILHASVVMLSSKVGLIALRAADGRYYVRAASGIDTTLVPTLNDYLNQLADIIDAGEDAETFNAKLREMAGEVAPDLRQSVALPLSFADEPLGMMIVFRTYRGAANANDVQILASFADQAAIAVHNAQLYERINHERKSLAAILDFSADGVMILSPDLNIERFNRALERMTGWQASEAIGQHQDVVIVWDRLDSPDLQAALDAGWPYQPVGDTPSDEPLYVEGDLSRPDGLKLSIGITYAPLLGSDGTLASIIANVRDISNFRQAQEMQNTFVSIISHELKTPVAIIKGYAATLRRTDVTWDTDVIQDNLTVIEEESDRLNALIQNLLTASKIQTERQLSLDLGEVWLDQLARRSVERFQSQTSKHTIELDFPDNFPSIQGDEARLLQVLDNLIGNAIKYSPDGGTVKVKGRYDDSSVTIYVSDHGVGLSKEDQDRVFERFYRVDGTLSRKTQGTGLGLYLTKVIVDAHNGLIAVDSHPGTGSTFYFTLSR